ncbi:hypothetical protein BDQ12DRAFT_693561 [Crucibulum laeve]|uniref:Uncharacterized protein n=1 Tax=Crucibulum laeve TaxID=68775 RepID=A0A5C3LSM0_9AGAR|nr:hypothetical protein BDQ12DRAFT_693561 [Crucibulum laeve]
MIWTRNKPARSLTIDGLPLFYSRLAWIILNALILQTSIQLPSNRTTTSEILINWYCHCSLPKTLTESPRSPKLLQTI